ncbi:hypothetical protein EMCG_00813 [[Emmonsia] crescens]|uniref:Uncharacterized protein n=1 Tax=[Emmonsia] crescens TaxID=73230 RepID=A0A0G2J6F0_9EURO|nr:hypothetical protein EMCG_00813 [Emmonsia crescens UAMH 3008]
MFVIEHKYMPCNPLIPMPESSRFPIKAIVAIRKSYLENGNKTDNNPLTKTYGNWRTPSVKASPLLAAEQDLKNAGIVVINPHGSVSLIMNSMHTLQQRDSTIIALLYPEMHERLENMGPWRKIWNGHGIVSPLCVGKVGRAEVMLRSSSQRMVTVVVVDVRFGIHELVALVRFRKFSTSTVHSKDQAKGRLSLVHHHHHHHPEQSPA